MDTERSQQSLSNQLDRLAEMHRRGMLDDAAFARAKDAVLTQEDIGQAWADHLPTRQTPRPALWVAAGLGVGVVVVAAVAAVGMQGAGRTVDNDAAGARVMPDAEASDTPDVVRAILAEATDSPSVAEPRTEDDQGQVDPVATVREPEVAAGVQQTIVPPLAGLPAEEAQRLLVGSGLQPQLGDPEADENIPANHVVRSQPAEGTSVARGSMVTLILSRGAGTVTVPSVFSLAEADAVQALRAAGLQVNDILEEAAPDVPAGTALRSQPSAGVQVERGTSVILVMAS